jgi:site-specific DNA recombinase
MYRQEGVVGGASARLKLVRAAVYCRVSTDESLHLEFNSLHAQREACEAYIVSQRQEGWTVVATTYDDGGYSGGTLERPALQRLLAAIAAGQIDTIVIYKIDRLSRSLTDFAKIVEVLDRARASFISVTQSFNTTTSMGRLTLNVLLSFAQFEREVGAERVRDKIAASKAKGMFMGGVAPLGYEAKERKLVINEDEAETIRRTFNMYLKLASVLRLEEELDRQGIRSKLRTSCKGIVTGGRRFTRGALYALLQNPIYIGKVRHRENLYEGQHDAILNDETFERAQALLAKNRVEYRTRGCRTDMPLLTGLAWDHHGRRLSPSHTKKGAARYRYYSTKPNLDLRSKATRVAAADLERVVTKRLSRLLKDRSELYSLVQPFTPDAVSLEAVFFAASEAQRVLSSDAKAKQRELISGLVSRIDVLTDEVVIQVRPAALMHLANLTAVEQCPVELMVPVRLFRKAREVRLAIVPEQGEGEPAKDPALIKVITKAWEARNALFNGGGASVKEIAAGLRMDPDYFTVLVKLGFLAPSIVEAILNGRQPIELTRQKLARIRHLPFDWPEQEQLVGFA